ncbi:MAG: amidohydrolase family protein [bacterium]|nr:amidohydrolase family protein [bacterium]
MGWGKDAFHLKYHGGSVIIDCHTHLSGLSGEPKHPEELLRAMDEAGIGYSCVLAEDPSDAGPTTDSLIVATKAYPRLKVIGSAHVTGADDQHTQKLMRYLEDGTIHAVKFYPGYEDFYPTNETLFPMYEYCQKKRKTVMFHTGILMTGRGGRLKQVHPLEIDEVAYRFPNLTIVMAHFGNPWIMDCAAVVAKNKHVYTDVSAFFTENSSIGSEEQEDFVRRMGEFKRFVGDVKKCLFGTDWPLYSQKRYLEAVQAIPMTDEEQELVFWKNAATLFALNV